MHKITDEQLLDELKARFKENTKAFQDLKEANQQLLEVNKKLEESEGLKSHFISNVTNEIINPFTSIMGLARNILEVKKENWEKVISMVKLIHTEAFNLDFQLKNIFIAARIEAGEVFPEIMKVDIHSFVRNVIDSFEIERTKKLIQINYNQQSDKLFFNTDPEKIKIIVSNLLSNAIKFSFNESEIDLSVNKENNNLIIIVKDYGTGISELNQRIIFDRFKRLDSGINSINRGHGLGLSINKALIDFLNGKIEITSKLNKGTQFKIIIPEASSEAEGFVEESNEFIFNNDTIF